MKLKAYAKINLGLSVLGKRQDGYHNLQTIMQLINFYDNIEITKASNGIEFISNLPPFDEENLCFKAANLFLGKSKISSGVKIRLAKNIWIGAGLGGGSSCAATTLNAMNRLFNYPLTRKEIFNLAIHLGSDVPFFLEPKPALVSGKGDIIERLTTLEHKLNLLLVFPKLSISTIWAYKNLGQISNNSLGEIKNSFLDNNIKTLAKLLHNDFELLVFEHYPTVKGIKEKLLGMGALGAFLSGSGSCVYGIFQDVIKVSKESFSGCEVKMTNSL